ncbi:MAG TPA: DUF4232 domain-containing protein [Acidimicrobiales bacterium]|nr:DUF4232 domain-containing protein [Acidimicrobiales bacterium]
MRRAVPAAVAAAAVSLLASCSGSSEDSARSLTTVPVSVSEPTSTSSVPPEVTTTTGVAPTGPERCRGTAVEVTLLDERAAAGTSLIVFQVRNTGPGPCRLAGHPGAEALDASGRVLATARRGPGVILSGAPPAPVTVGARGTAYFAVQAPNICPDDAPPVDSERVRIVLPEDDAPVEVAAGLTVCPQPELLVSPVRASQAELAGG